MNSKQKSKNAEDSSPARKPQASAGKGNDKVDAGSMDQIRDILFGNQARDYENRFSKMEQTLVRESAELKDELLKRIDALETYIKQEIKDINERIKNESNDRADSHQAIRREMKDGFESITKKLLKDEENLSKKSTELREQILEQSKTLSEQILSKYDQAENNLKQAADELNDMKVNRSDLSGFFLEIAMRLSNDETSGG